MRLAPKESSGERSLTPLADLVPEGSRVVLLGLSLAGGLLALLLVGSPSTKASMASVAIVAGIPIALLLLLYPEWAVVAYCFSMPFEVLSDSAGGLGTVPKLIGMVMVASIALNYLLGRLPLRPSKPHLLVTLAWSLWLLLVMCINATSIFANAESMSSARSIINNVLCYLVISSLGDQRTTWHRAIIALALGTGPALVWAKFTGKIRGGFEFAYLSTQNGSHSSIGFYASMAVLLGWPLLLLPRYPKWLRAGLGCALLGSVYVLAQTSCRQAVVGGVFGGVAAFSLALAWAPRTRSEGAGRSDQSSALLSRSKVMLAGGLALASVLLILVVTGSWDNVANGVWWRFYSEFSGPVGDSSGTGRIGLWKVALGHYWGGPWYGSGLYAFGMLHNIVLEMLCDGGPILVACSIAFVLVHLRGILCPRPDQEKLLSLEQLLWHAAFLGAAIGLFVQTMLAPLEWHKMLWLFWALSVRLPLYATDEGAPPSAIVEASRTAGIVS